MLNRIRRLVSETRKIKIALLALLALGSLLVPERARALPTASTFIVNSNSDATDWNPGDGKCETAMNNNVCTLRAAITEANAASGSTIVFGLPGSVTYLLTLGGLSITADMSIVGNGPANTIIDGDGSVTNSRVFTISPALVVTMSGVTISHGRSNQGAGIYNPGSLWLTNSIVSNNTVDIGATPRVGGGIYNTGVLTISNSVINGNSAPAVGITGGGGGISDVGGTMFLINSTLDSNSTCCLGGAIHVDGGSVSLLNSTVKSNTANNGGGIFNGGFSGSGTLYIANSTFTANTSTENAFPGGGGGILNYSGAATLINSTLYSNYANRSGGGLYDDSSGASYLYNVTVAGNIADLDYDGVGVGGGIFTSGTVNFRNTIIAKNLISTGPVCCDIPSDCAGSINSEDYNLIQTTSGCTILGATGNNKTGMDPQLGPLQYNGGPTRTAALLPGSPALDTANTGGCRDALGALILTDQRGFIRPFPTGGRCDIGAFEFGWTLLLPIILKP